ncbi:MAG: HupE/UreJ family protein [Verrucomicrobiota bacterium]
MKLHNSYQTPLGGVAVLAALIPAVSSAHNAGPEHLHVTSTFAIPTYGLLFVAVLAGLAALLMPRRLKTFPLILMGLAGVPALAQAHHVMDTNMHPFLGGLTLPIHGLDHILAMVAVGLWAAAGTTAKQRWVFPASFVGFTIVGMILGFVRVPFPLVETGIWVSVVAFGVLLAVLGKMPNIIVAILVGLFGLFHGYACGADLPNVWSPWIYGAGLVACTVGLVGIGYGVGLLIYKWAGERGVQIAGACTAAAMLGALISPLLSAA